MVLIIMNCDICGNHDDMEKCKECDTCEREHIQKFGLNWGQKARFVKKEPCIHIARFQLPNNQWVEYKCTKNLGHTGSCNFGVNTKTVERMARDVSGK